MLARAWKAVTGSPSGIVGLILLVLMTTVALAGPVLAPYDARELAGPPFQAPSRDHLLGTNDIGQDIFSEVLTGARSSLFVGLVAAGAAIVIGTGVGVVAGLAGGRVDAVLMRLTDIVLIIPFLPLVVVVAAFLGPGLMNIAITLALVIWARPARVVRAQALGIRSCAYFEAAVALGARFGHILARHLLPAVLPIALSQFILAASSSILAEAGLAFLGLGDPIQKSWGGILYYAQARGAFLSGSWPWWVLPPGLLIAVSVLAFALTGRALEEALMPRLRRR